MLDCHVDLEEELNSLTNHAPEGEAARHGNYLSIAFIVNNEAVWSVLNEPYTIHIVPNQRTEQYIFVFNACGTVANDSLINDKFYVLCRRTFDSIC